MERKILDAVRDLGEAIDRDREAVKDAFEAVGEKFELHSKMIQRAQYAPLNHADDGPARPTVSASIDRRALAGDNYDVTAKAIAPHIRKGGTLDGWHEDTALLADAWLRIATRGQSRQLRPDHRDAERIAQLYEALGGVAKADYAEGAVGTGGYLVPVLVAGELLRIALDAGVVTSRCRRLPMNSRDQVFPAEASNVTVHWVNEAAQLTQGENTFGSVTLKAKKLAGRAQASIELVEDSTVPLLAYVQGAFAEAIGRELDQELVEGTGTNFTGLDATSGVNVVYCGAGVTGTSISYAKLVQTMFYAGEASSRDRSVWLAKPITFAEVMKLEDTQGQPIFSGPVAAGAPMTILGKAVGLSNALNTYSAGAVASGKLYFGDPLSILLGVRQDLRWDVTDAVGWSTYQLDMRLVGRFGGAVSNAANWTRLLGVKINS